MADKVTVTSPVIVARRDEIDEIVTALHAALDVGQGGEWQDDVLDALDVCARMLQRTAAREERHE